MHTLIHLCLHPDTTIHNIIYKPGPNPYIGDWLSRNNHTIDRDWEITGMNIDVSAISAIVNMSVCTSIKAIKPETYEDAHLQC